MSFKRFLKSFFKRAFFWYAGAFVTALGFALGFFHILAGLFVLAVGLVMILYGKYLDKQKKEKELRKYRR